MHWRTGRGCWSPEFCLSFLFLLFILAFSGGFKKEYSLLQENNLMITVHLDDLHPV